MLQGQTVFSQLMEFLPRHTFRKCVNRYQGNYRMRSFSCHDQFLCMAFAQLTARESLRDIECCLRALEEKLYHAGFRGNKRVELCLSSSGILNIIAGVVCWFSKIWRVWGQ